MNTIYTYRPKTQKSKNALRNFFRKNSDAIQVILALVIFAITSWIFWSCLLERI